MQMACAVKVKWYTTSPFAEAGPDDMPPLEGEDDEDDASRMEEVD